MDAEAPERRLPPPWLGHLLVFGLLFALALGWFLLQTRQAQRVFLDDTAARAHLLADAVTLHARGALVAEDATSALVARFLASSARFVAYLDGIARFDAQELGAFAAEAGLAAIRIVRPDGTVQGPADWEPGMRLDCSRPDRPIKLPAAHAVALATALADGGCVLVAMDGRDSEALEAAIGLPRALESVASLPGVLALRLEGEPRGEAPAAEGAAEAPELPPVAIRTLADGRTVASASARVAGARLLLDLDAGPLLAMRARLWLELLGFVLVLGGSGAAGAWVLYRHQRAGERQRLDYERRLSRQREEAGLGRAAAAIALPGAPAD